MKGGKATKRKGLADVVFLPKRNQRLDEALREAANNTANMVY